MQIIARCKSPPNSISSFIVLALLVLLLIDTLIIVWASWTSLSLASGIASDVNCSTSAQISRLRESLVSAAIVL
jgi:hypothetical protein